MKRIVLLTDFSETARNAMKFAIKMFQNVKVQFYMLNAFDAEFGGSPYIMRVKQEMEEESMKGLKSEMAGLHAKFPHVRVELVSRYGPLVDVLLKENTEDGINPDIIVMGCRGESALENFLLGSNAFDVIKNVHKPMMTIPLGAKFTPPQKIAFATDLVSIDQKMANPLMDLLQMYDSELLFVNVLDDRPINRLEAEERIARFFPGVKMSFHFLDSDDVCKSVCSFAEENEAEMVVMVRHNYSFFERLFHPSLTKKMVLHPQFPMIVLHAEKQ